MAEKEELSKIQEALALCGFYPGDNDGIMGPNTKEAIQAFQKSAGLDVDGIPGPNTRKALSQALGQAMARATTLMTELSIDTK